MSVLCVHQVAAGFELADPPVEIHQVSTQVALDLRKDFVNLLKLRINRGRQIVEPRMHPVADPCENGNQKAEDDAHQGEDFGGVFGHD